ncbi:hypothetical protein [Streptomyces sp. NPDC047718]|uniref:hypothetical protein n=1 Tax=Streptomyces sp. NPDC047718 TaxID=3155479 RepID=UPI0033D6C384
MELLTEAEAVFPTVLRDLYADRLGGVALAEEDGRRFFLLSDTAGRRIELRLDTAALPQSLVARTFTNTTTDRYVIQLADTLPPEQAGRVLSGEVGELLAVRERSAASGRAPLENLLVTGPVLASYPELSDVDLRRVGEFDYLAARMNDPGVAAAERMEARALFSTLVDESGLRPQAPVVDRQTHSAEQHAAAVRLDLVRPRLRPEARAAMADLTVPIEQLGPADAEALAAVRASRAQTSEVPPTQLLAGLPMPGLRPDGTPIPREALQAFAEEAARQRTDLSSRTLAALREQQAGLPEGRYPQFPVMIGGGAALAGRDPDALLIDARGRWHVDPIVAIVQSADQVRHLRQSGMGDPYQFAGPQERVPLPALQLWEDTAAARGPLVDGRAELSIGAEGRLIAEIVPADGSAPVKVEVVGSPLIATGIPPEIIPGANRQLPTVREATDALAEHLTGVGTPEAVAARDRLQALPAGEGQAAAALGVLDDPQGAAFMRDATDSRVAGATETLRATSAWDEARAAAPGRVLMGDEVGDGDYDPAVAKHWLIAGVGGAAIANAEIILQANPETRVSMVGKDAPFVLHNDAQYTALRRKHDAAWGGDGRLVTHSGLYLGAVATTTSPDGGVRLTALDSAGKPLGIEGDAYVACLGRISRLPNALDAVESEVRASGGQVRGELVFDADRQYLGYRLEFEANGRRHAVGVTGAASRMLPGEVFGREDQTRLAALDAKTAPPESGNVAAGFMATALQGAYLARHRAAGGRGPNDPDGPGGLSNPPGGPIGPASAAAPPDAASPTATVPASASYASPSAARNGGEEVARSFRAWIHSDMGRELAASTHPRISALREAWRQLPPHDLPHGPVAAAAPYRSVAERAHAVVTAAVAADRFAPADVKALQAVAQAAATHSVRLTATQPGAAAGVVGQRAAATPQVAAPAPRVAMSPTDAVRSPRLGA